MDFHKNEILTISEDKEKAKLYKLYIGLNDKDKLIDWIEYIDSSADVELFLKKEFTFSAQFNTGLPIGTLTGFYNNELFMFDSEIVYSEANDYGNPLKEKIPIGKKYIYPIPNSHINIFYEGLNNFFKKDEYYNELVDYDIRCEKPTKKYCFNKYDLILGPLFCGLKTGDLLIKKGKHQTLEDISNKLKNICDPFNLKDIDTSDILMVSSNNGYYSNVNIIIKGNDNTNTTSNLSFDDCVIPLKLIFSEKLYHKLEKDFKEGITNSRKEEESENDISTYFEYVIL